MNTDNGIVKLCARICLEGSISDTGKIDLYICSKYGLTKKDVHGVGTRTITNVGLAGIHTPPQEAVCAGVAIIEAKHMREHIMD